MQRLASAPRGLACPLQDRAYSCTVGSRPAPHSQLLPSLNLRDCRHPSLQLQLRNGSTSTAFAPTPLTRTRARSSITSRSSNSRSTSCQHPGASRPFSSPPGNVPRPITLRLQSPPHSQSHSTLRQNEHSARSNKPLQSPLATKAFQGDTGGTAKGAPPSAIQRLFRRTVRELSSLPLAIGLLFAIAGVCALGTVIEQGASPGQYMQDYPLESPVLGVLTWQVILGLGLDHVYTNPAFLLLLALFGGCLASCTSTRQLPMLKVARRWSFLGKPSSIRALQFSESLPSARLADVGVELQRNGYEVFREGNSLYGFKGLVGRLAPIGVHAAMLLVMLGGTYSSLGGFHGSVMVPEGLQVVVPDALRGNSWAARPSSSMNMVLELDGFRVDYRPNGEVKQYYSDLTMRDYLGRELLHKTISVNVPLRCQGVTIYQTDWAISAVQLRVDGGEPLQLPVASLPEPSGTDAKLFGTFLPLPGEESQAGVTPKGITILARDFQSVVLYDSEGQFVGVRRPGSKKPIKINDISIVVDDVIGSSGMELKSDPGVPLVYSGFGALMLTSFISYLSHSQVWAFQEGSTVHLGGRSNRAKYSFQEELNKVADAIPEIVPTSEDKPQDPPRKATAKP